LITYNTQKTVIMLILTKPFISENIIIIPDVQTIQANPEFISVCSENETNCLQKWGLNYVSPTDWVALAKLPEWLSFKYATETVTLKETIIWLYNSDQDLCIRSLGITINCFWTLLSQYQANEFKTKHSQSETRRNPNLQNIVNRDETLSAYRFTKWEFSPNVNLPEIRA